MSDQMPRLIRLCARPARGGAFSDIAPSALEAFVASEAVHEVLDFDLLNCGDLGRRSTGQLTSKILMPPGDNGMNAQRPERATAPGFWKIWPSLTGQYQRLFLARQKLEKKRQGLNIS